MGDFLYEKIAQNSYKQFNFLPKTGKPNTLEWTVLSTITKHNLLDNSLEVVALGTGSKCIGISKMSSKGDILNDSHSEVICRRAFLRYLLEEINNSAKGFGDTFDFDKQSGLCSLKDNIEFHFFTTQVPCGDASIFPKSLVEDFGNCLNKKETDAANDNVPNKKMKIDINITGAKCLPQLEVQDLKSRYTFCDIVGEVRTKPGRGSPTLSVSCSDKFAKWCHLGVQGSLTSLLLKNGIFMKSLIVASKAFDKTALQRAIFDRFDKYCLQELLDEVKRLEIVQLEEKFEFSKTDNKRPCPSSIIWSKIKHKPFEVAIEGKRQGVTKNKLNTESARLQICKMELFRSFNNILVENTDFKISKTFLKDQTYLAAKLNAKDYQIKWNYLKKNGFKAWTCKNKSLEDFKLD